MLHEWHVKFEALYADVVSYGAVAATLEQE
jgi:hypothetical protein